MHKCTNPNHKSLAQCYSSFCAAEFPRDDNYVLNINIDQYQCNLIKLKFLIIRLRRRPSVKDWSLFSFYFRSACEEYIPIMNSRWLLSILETYADCAEEPLRNNAMLATVPVTWERFSQTLIKNAWIVRDNPKKEMYGQKPIYDGLMTQQLLLADTPTNFFKRTMNILESTPIIQMIYVELIKRMLNTKESTLHKLTIASKWDMKSSILKELNKEYHE